MDFKEILKSDVKNVFLNPREFAEEHSINGKKLTLVIQEDMLENFNIRQSSEGRERRAAGLYSGGIAVYASAADIHEAFNGTHPKPQGMIELDGKKYIVISSDKMGGFYKMHLRRYGAR